MFISDCPKGTYGIECRFKCACADNISCDAVSGKCLCPADKTGMTCDQGRNVSLCIYNSPEFAISLTPGFLLPSMTKCN